MRHTRCVVAALALVLALAGCRGSDAAMLPTPAAVTSESAETTHATTPTTSPAPTPTADPIDLAVVGDSLTSGINQTFPHPVPPFAANTWLYWALSPELVLAGGWAYPGARSADMAAHVLPVTADVLVVQATTNDAGNTPVAEAMDSLEVAIATAAVSPVIVCAIPPKASAAHEVPIFNGALLAMAGAHDWTFIDPWADFRTPDGDWVSGASPDGVHPTDATARAAADVIVLAISH